MHNQSKREKLLNYLKESKKERIPLSQDDINRIVTNNTACPDEKIIFTEHYRYLMKNHDLKDRKARLNEVWEYITLAEYKGSVKEYPTEE